MTNPGTTIRITGHPPDRASRTTALIRIAHGPDAGAEWPVRDDVLILGSATECGAVLTDPSVSRRHLGVRLVENGFEVEDLGSRNGTLLDGARIDRAVVPLGTTLGVGRSVLQLLPAEQVVELPPSGRDRFGELIGESMAMRRVFAILERAASSDVSVLLLGESGVGKELAARAIHTEGPRAEAPFVVFDCGAANETLIASDLFGHRRGAFTGAHADRPGAFANAHGGTLFLDEIGDLPLELQPKLLRMLERGEVIPLGASKPERYDVRIVAATHRDLPEMVECGTFRGDLYYRLAVLEAELPPLRARREDVPRLVSHFLERAKAPTEVPACPNQRALLAYDWPGNVRELRNVIARAVALSEPASRFDAMPILMGRGRHRTATSEPPIDVDRPWSEVKAEVVGRTERAYFTALLSRHGDNLAEAARRAGIERRYLYSMLDKLGLERPTK